MELQKHRNRFLQSMWNKYGASAFVFRAIEVGVRVEHLAAVEQSLLNYYSRHGRVANLAPIAGSNRGVVRTPETREKISAGLKGKPKSPRARANMSVAHAGKPNTYKGKTYSPDVRQRMRAGKSHLANAVERIDVSTGEVKEYVSMCEAHRDGFDKAKISLCVHGRAQSHRGFFWKRAV
jgi:group I intron endonuclease